MIIVIAIVAMAIAALLYAVGHSEACPITTRPSAYFDDYDCWMSTKQSEPPPAVS